MLGNAGSVKTLIKPSSEAIVEGMRLLSTIGGGTKASKDLLQKMLDIQKHNEAVAKEAKETLAIIHKSSKALNFDRAAFLAEKAEQDDRIRGLNEDLLLEKSKLKSKESRIEAERKAETSRLQELMQDGKRLVAENTESKKRLVKDRNALSVDEEVLEQREKQLAHKEEKLKMTTSALESILSSIED